MPSFKIVFELPVTVYKFKKQPKVNFKINHPQDILIAKNDQRREKYKRKNKSKEELI